jgi:hypothetical protein
MDGGVPRVVEAGVFDGGRDVTCVGGGELCSRRPYLIRTCSQRPLSVRVRVQLYVYVYICM